MTRVPLFMLVGCLVVAASGCSDTSPTTPTPTTTTTFEGTFAGSGGTNGTLQIAIQGALAASIDGSGAPTAVNFGWLVPRAIAATLDGSGTLSFIGGGEVALVGTYDDVTRVVMVRSGSVGLNNFPRYISGLRADCGRCRVVHGVGRRMRRPDRRRGPLEAHREGHLTQPPSWVAARPGTFQSA